MPSPRVLKLPRFQADLVYVVCVHSSTVDTTPPGPNCLSVSMLLQIYKRSLWKDSTSDGELNVGTDSIELEGWDPSETRSSNLPLCPHSLKHATHRGPNIRMHAPNLRDKFQLLTNGLDSEVKVSVQMRPIIQERCRCCHPGGCNVF